MVTVVVFFAAHVYAGTIARLARAAGDPDVERPSVRASVAASVHHSEGLLVISLIPLAVLLLGVTHIVDDDIAIWSALLLDTALLALLGWVAAARWTTRFWPRVGSAAMTALFGIVIVVLKSLIHH
ncbi:MAG: hypothetical protein WBP48_14410 [Microbacterium sp.]